MNSSVGTHPPPSTVPRKTRRRRRDGGGGGAPSTPLHYWTLYNNNIKSKKHLHSFSDIGDADEANFSGGGHAVELSARKLAAGLWRLRYGIGGFSASRKSSCRSRFKPGMSHANLMPSRDRSSKGHRSGTKHQLQRSQSSIVDPKQGSLHKNSKFLNKGAMQRDCRCSKSSPIEASCFASRIKFLEDQVKTVSFVSALQAELVQARLYIHDLEYEVQSSRHRIKYLERKLGAEGTSQQRKEHEKIYALVDDLKGQLSRERTKEQKMEVIKSQLIKEVAEAKLSSMQSVQKYKAEKRTRKLLEEICRELAREIGEDEAEVEAMRMETMRIREEIEEERSMLHVAEVWREERVQMKLIDAKLALESKHSQLNKLKTVLETFLMSRSTSLTMRDLKKAEMIGEATKAVSIRDMEEFSYEHLRSEDIFSIFEGLRQGTIFEREINPWFNSALTDDISDYNNGMKEDAKGHEKVYHVENRGSVEEVTALL